MASRARRAALLGALPLLAGLLGCQGPAVPIEEDDTPPVLEVAPITSDVTADPQAAMAREAMLAARYEDARRVYEHLARQDPDPARRAEFLFLAGECALGAEEYFEAYQLYRALLQQYPRTPRFATVVERIFLVGRLFCVGRAEKPSWLLGIEMTDPEFGVQVLERFQKARERHPLADDALHYVAVAQLELGEYELAIDAWEKLAREYPESEWAESAQYRVGLTMLALSDGPEYDKAPLRAALARLRKYTEVYPNGDHAAAAREVIAEHEEGLAAQQLDVARYYLRHDRPYAADLYLVAVQRDYPNTEAAREALALQRRQPRTSPPPPKEPPQDLGSAGESGPEEDRLRLAPAPIDDSW